MAAIGFVQLSPERVMAWRRRRVDAAAHADWPEVLPGDPALSSVTVSRVLRDLPKIASHGACAVRVEGGRVEIAALLAEPHVAAWWRPLATALRLVSVDGGRGRFDLVGFLGDAPGCTIAIEPGQSALRMLTDAEIDAIQQSEPYGWLDEVMSGSPRPLPPFDATYAG